MARYRHVARTGVSQGTIVAIVPTTVKPEVTAASTGSMPGTAGEGDGKAGGEHQAENTGVGKVAAQQICGIAHGFEGEAHLRGGRWHSYPAAALSCSATFACTAPKTPAPCP